MYMNTRGLGKWQKRAQMHSQAEGWESAKTGHGIEWKGMHSQAPSCTLIHCNTDEKGLGLDSQMFGPVLLVL